MLHRAPFAILLTFAVAGCSAADPADLHAEADIQDEQAEMMAIAALFGGEPEVVAQRGVVDVVLDAVIPSAHAEGEEQDPSVFWDTCSASPPSYVVASDVGTSGAFGPEGAQVALAADTDFCMDSAGNAVDNTDNRQYRSFNITNVTISCSWGATFTATASGVYRNNPDAGELPAVYGDFTIDDGTGPSAYDCRLMNSPAEDGEGIESDDAGVLTSALCRVPGAGVTSELNRADGRSETCTVVP